MVCPAPYDRLGGKCHVGMATVNAGAAVDPPTSARVDITLSDSYFYHNFSDFIRSQINRVNR